MAQHCSLCPVVNKVCFWGPRAEEAWKRPSLFVASIFITALGALVFVPNVLDSVATYVLYSFILVMGVFGIVVSIFGCNACVARAFGEASF